MNRSTKPKTLMWRLILAMFAGIVVWTLVASLLNLGLRLTLPSYAAAEAQQSFTPMMLIARLVIGALASLAAGAAAGWIDKPLGGSVWVIAAALSAAFIMMHINIWSEFPAWYHLTFLVTLGPLIVLGSLLGHKRASEGAAGGVQQA